VSEPGTVFVVDDDGAVRTGLARLVRASGLDVETFESAAAFLARLPVGGVGCVLLDLRMPDVDGASLQERLAEIDPGLPIIFVTGHGEVPDSVKAIKRGAVDFLTKPVDDDVLLAAIGEALERHRAARSAEGDRAAIDARIASLTAREMDVMRRVIGGALNKQIAAHLGIAEGTVKVHRGRVMEKMAAGSVADLVRLCGAAGVSPLACEQRRATS
jgi:FixJ family two-component response regulator